MSDKKDISIRLWNSWRKQGKLAQRCQIIGDKIYPCIIRLKSGLYVAGDIEYRGHGLPAIVHVWAPSTAEFLVDRLASEQRIAV